MSQKLSIPTIVVQEASPTAKPKKPPKPARRRSETVTISDKSLNSDKDQNQLTAPSTPTNNDNNVKPRSGSSDNIHHQPSVAGVRSRSGTDLRCHVLSRDRTVSSASADSGVPLTPAGSNPQLTESHQNQVHHHHQPQLSLKTGCYGYLRCDSSEPDVPITWQFPDASEDDQDDDDDDNESSEPLPVYPGEDEATVDLESEEELINAENDNQVSRQGPTPSVHFSRSTIDLYESNRRSKRLTRNPRREKRVRSLGIYDPALNLEKIDNTLCPEPIVFNPVIVDVEPIDQIRFNESMNPTLPLRNAVNARRDSWWSQYSRRLTGTGTATDNVCQQCRRDDPGASQCRPGCRNLIIETPATRSIIDRMRCVPDCMRDWYPDNFMSCGAIAIAVVVLLICTVHIILTSERLDPVRQAIMSSSNFRLPRNVMPSAYELSVIPFFAEGHFHGQVRVRIHVFSDTKSVIMHAVDLDIFENSTEIHRVRYPRQYPGEPVQIKTQYLDPERDFFIVETKEALKANGTYLLTTEFRGKLRDDFRGFYRVSKDYYPSIHARPVSHVPGGNSMMQPNYFTSWIGVAQPQLTDARRIFPCFDEPEFKAKFTISVARLLNMTAMTSEPLLNDTEKTAWDDYYWDRFDESQPMPTYLVSFVVSDLDGNFFSKKGFNVSVWTPGRQKKNTDYLEPVADLLNFFNYSFGVPSPLRKFEMIAMPDFLNSAIGECNLFACSESDLLLENNPKNRGQIISRIANSMSRQFFGTLMTPLSWYEFPLLEGIIRYTAYIAVDLIDPNLNVLDHFVVDELQKSMIGYQRYILATVDLVTIKDIPTFAEKIYYEKAASVVRMIEFFTNFTFENALTHFVKHEAYLETNDFIQLVSEEAVNSSLVIKDLNASGGNDSLSEKYANFRNALDSWFNRPGYPVLTVTRNYTTRAITFSQTRFVTIDSLKKKKKKNDDDEFEDLWWIPITYATQTTLNFNKTLPEFWLSSSEATIEDFNCVTGHWIIVNVHQTGYYRVNYDRRNWNMIIAFLMNQNLDFVPATNRAQLIDDAFNLARAGLLHYKTAFRLLLYLERETDPLPWKAARANLDFLNSMLFYDSIYSKFQEFIINLLSTAYKNHVLSSHEPNAVLVELACKFQVPEIVEVARKQFQQYRENIETLQLENPIAPEYRGIYYCAVIRRSQDIKDWNFLWQRYLSEKESAVERGNILEGLGCSENSEFLDNYLEWAVTDGNRLRQQDVVKIFDAATREFNVIGQRTAFATFRKNWTTIRDRFADSPVLMRNVMKMVTRRASTIKDQLKFKLFVRSHKFELGDSYELFEDAIVESMGNAHWQENQAEQIRFWLTNPAKETDPVETEDNSQILSNAISDNIPNP